MRNGFKHSINFTATRVAVVSLFLGGISMFLFKNNSDTGLVAIGYLIAALIFMVNTIVFLPLLINAVRRFKDYKENLFAMLLLLPNIPISGLYLELI